MSVALAPPNRGAYFFYGGSEASGSAEQTIDISGGTTAIDDGQVRCELSAYLGGYASQEDNAIVTARFMSAANTMISSIQVGPVSSSDREDITGLLYRSSQMIIPAGTRTIVIHIDIQRDEGSDNDGYVDNISLILTQCGGDDGGTCDADHFDLCTTENDCVAAGGSWYNSSCHEFPEVGGASGHNGMPASALALVDFPAVSVNPTTNSVHVGTCADVIVQPSMEVPAADVGQTAQLIMYIYLPDLGFGINIPSRPVTLQAETLCDLLPNPIDLSTSAGLSFYVYYGYVLGSSIKYSAYAVVIDPFCADDCGSITDASVCDATPGCAYQNFPVAQCVPDCGSFTSKTSCEDAFDGDSCGWNDTFSTCTPK